MSIRDLKFSFTPVPTTFMYLMDSDCYKAMALLIHFESYWKSNNKLNNGYFTKTIGEIKDALFMGNEKDARLTIEALYRSKLINVYATDGKRSPLLIRLNWYKINEVAKMSIKEIQEFETPIVKLRRDETLTYCQHKVEDKNEIDNNLNTECTPTIYNTENKERIEKEIEEKEDNFSSRFANDDESELKVSKPFNDNPDTENSEQVPLDTNAKKQMIEAVRHNLYSIAFREISNSETITQEDEIYQDTINIIMRYNACERQKAISKYNYLIQGYRDGITKELEKESMQAVSC